MHVWERERGMERGREKEFKETIPMKYKHELSYRNSSAKAFKMLWYIFFLLRK